MTVEVSANAPVTLDLELPWSSSEEQDKKFRKLLTRLLILLLLLFLIFPWLPLPEISREEAEKLPPQLARVILEEAEKAKPPEPIAEPEPEPEVVQETETVVEQAPAEPKPVEAPKPVPNEVQAAREKVKSIGVAGAASQLSSLRSSLNLSALSVKNNNVSNGGAKETARSVLGASNATSTSGGLKASDVSTDLGTSELAGKNSEAVDGNIDLGGSGSGVGSGDGDGQYASNRLTGRDMESIRRVFEAEKGAIYSLYTRALRKDPNLQGKFVFELVIKPDGSVADLKLIESELGDDNLEKRILSRIRLISFGAADAADTPVNYTYDFLPG